MSKRGRKSEQKKENVSNGRIDGDKPEWEGGARCGMVRPGASRRVARKRKEERTYARGVCAARRRVERVGGSRESVREEQNGRNDLE